MTELTLKMEEPDFHGVGVELYAPLYVLKDFARCSETLQFVVMASCEDGTGHVL